VDGYQEQIARSRLIACERMPYMSSMLYMMVPIEFAPCRTAGVTKDGVLLYNRDFVEKQSEKTLAGVLLHEAMHILSDHHGRAAAIATERDLFLWNVSADFEINDDLIAAGVSLPSDCCLPWKRGLPPYQVAEMYYSLLKEREESQDSVPQVQCGSGAGNPFEGEPQLGCDIEERKALLERAVYDTVKSAQRHAGNIPDGIKILIDKILPVDKVNWQSVLNQFVCSSSERARGLFDLTYGRLSRRQTAQSRIILPAYYKPTPTLGVLVDTSGSMSEHDLKAGLGAIKSLFNHVSNVWLCVVDAEIHDLRKCKSAEDIAATLVGGGGTDFSKAIPQLDKLCDFMVGISDCYATYPSEKPRHDILWLLVGDGQPPWGKTVKVD